MAIDDRRDSVPKGAPSSSLVQSAAVVRRQTLRVSTVAPSHRTMNWSSVVGSGTASRMVVQPVLQRTGPWIDGVPEVSLVQRTPPLLAVSVQATRTAVLARTAEIDD